MRIAVLQEREAGERRVAATPETVRKFCALGATVAVFQEGAFGLLEAVLFVLVIFFGSLFALAKPNDRLLNPLMRAVPPNLRPAFYRIFQLLGERLLGWLKGTAMAIVSPAR